MSQLPTDEDRLGRAAGRDAAHAMAAVENAPGALAVADASGLCDLPSIDAALKAILASEQFRTAPQLSSFLSFVVNRARDGRSAEIKGYTIAVEALGRPAHFDPQQDPIVRVEAMRLRRALDAYYAGPGATDALRIRLPRGGYVPLFERAPAREISPPAGAARVRRPWLDRLAPSALLSGWTDGEFWQRRWRAVGIAAFIGGALATGLVTIPGLRLQGQGPAPLSRTIIPSPGLALVEVELLDADVPSAQRFTARVMEALARFEEIDVIERARGPSALLKAVDAPSLRYVLSISATEMSGDAGGGTISARLTYGPTGQIVWVTNVVLGDDDELAEAQRVASQLGQPYGVIFADLRARPDIQANARCLIGAFDYMQHPTPAAHAQARRCLESIEAEGTVYASVRFALTRIYLDEARRGYNAKPDALNRALAAADAAARAAPGSARARQALMAALFARRDFEGAIEAGLEALALNPADTMLMADLGSRYIAMGRYEDGLPLVKKAVELNPARPASADFHLFVAARMTGEKDAARHAAARLGARETLLSLIAQISAAALDEDMDRAALLVTRLADIAPDFVKNPQAALERMALASDIADMFAGDLRKAGLVAASAVVPEKATIRQ